LTGEWRTVRPWRRAHGRKQPVRRTCASVFQPLQARRRRQAVQSPREMTDPGQFDAKQLLALLGRGELRQIGRRRIAI